MHAFGVLVRIIDRPRQALSLACEHPRSWWLAAVLIVLSALASIWVSAPIQAELAQERAEEMVDRITASMPEEQAEAVRERNTAITPQRLMLTSGAAAIVISALGWVLRGGIVHLSSLAAGAASVWSSTYAACVWSMVPFAARDLLQTAFVVIKQSTIEHKGLSFLVASGDWLADSGDTVYVLLSNIDLFALWHLLLFASAISVSTKLGRTKGAIMALLVWGVFLALKLVPAIIGRAVTGGMMGS